MARRTARYDPTRSTGGADGFGFVLLLIEDIMHAFEVRRLAPVAIGAAAFLIAQGLGHALGWAPVEQLLACLAMFLALNAFWRGTSRRFGAG